MYLLRATAFSCRWGWISAVLAVLLLAACKGGGSDVGPRFAEWEGRVLVGSVLDPAGRPIRSARVQIANRSTATDASGRFHLQNPPEGPQHLRVDGRYAALEDTAEAFASYTIPIEITEAHQDLERPLYLSDLASGAAAVLPIGIPLAPGTRLIDGRTGSVLILDGVVLGFADPSLHPGQNDVEVQFGVLAGSQIPLGVEANVASPIQNGTVAIIQPGDLVLSGARMELRDELSLPAATPGIVNYGLAPTDREWMPLGPAVAFGGVIDTGSVVREGGLFTYGRVCSSGAETTTVEGQIVDLEGNPVRGVLVAVGARAGVSDSKGRYAVEDVCAVDGMGMARDLPVHFETGRKHRALSLELMVTMVPGGSTSVTDQLMAVTEVSSLSVMSVYQGEERSGLRVSVGSMSMASRSLPTGPDGIARFRDLPVAKRAASQSHRRGIKDPKDDDYEYRIFSFQGSGKAREQKLYLDERRLKVRRLDGNVAIRVVVRDSSAPVREAFVMVGLDGNKKGKREITQESGTAHFSKAGKNSGTFTAGIQTEVAASEPGIDRIRRISYKSLYGVDSRHVVLDLLMATDTGGRQAGPSYGVLEGEVLGLTDPGQTPPTNLRYEALVTSAPEVHLEELAVDLLGLEEGYVVLREDLPTRDPEASFSDPEFSAAVDVGAVRAMAVERDVDASSVGPVVRAGLSQSLEVGAGEAVRADAALTRAVPGFSIPLAAIKLDPALWASTPRVEFGWYDQGGTGFWGGDLRNFTFTPSLQLLDLFIPPAPALLQGGEVAFVQWAGGTASEEYWQSAFQPDPAVQGGIELLDIPRMLQPAPGGILDPTGSGILFQNDTAANNIRLRISRSQTVDEGGVIVRIDYEWEVDVSPNVSQVIFPVLPDMVGKHEIPQFFEGGSYLVELLTWRGEQMDYDTRASFRDVLLEWEQDPRVASLYRSTIVIP